jgi:hypothetical protein
VPGDGRAGRVLVGRDAANAAVEQRRAGGAEAVAAAGAPGGHVGDAGRDDLEAVEESFDIVAGAGDAGCGRAVVGSCGGLRGVGARWSAVT